jgi:hypothetical protein
MDRVIELCSFEGARVKGNWLCRFPGFPKGEYCTGAFVAHVGSNKIFVISHVFMVDGSQAVGTCNNSFDLVERELVFAVPLREFLVGCLGSQTV